MKWQLILLASFVCLALALPKAKEDGHKKVSTIDKLAAAKVVPKKRSEENNHQAAPVKKVKTGGLDLHIQKKRAASPIPVSKPIHQLKRPVPKPIRPLNQGKPAAGLKNKRSPIPTSGGNKKQ